MVNGKVENIKIDGHLGTWYIIAEETDEDLGCGLDAKMYLLEHEEFGNDAAWLIVNRDGIIICEDVWNGFDDYWEQKEMMANDY